MRMLAKKGKILTMQDVGLFLLIRDLIGTDPIIGTISFS